MRHCARQAYNGALSDARTSYMCTTPACEPAATSAPSGATVTACVAEGCSRARRAGSHTGRHADTLRTMPGSAGDLQSVEAHLLSSASQPNVSTLKRAPRVGSSCTRIARARRCIYLHLCAFSLATNTVFEHCPRPLPLAIALP